MKKILLSTFAASLLLWSCGTNQESESKSDETTTEAAAVTETPEATPAPMPDSATVMKNWQDYATPGEMHKQMAALAGKWRDSMTMWYEPGGPAQNYISTSEYKMEMGDRYLVSSHTGDMMGMPFEGKSTMAYDNARKVFINTWYDNMGTGMMVLEGPYDEASKSIILTGKMVDPSRGDATQLNVRQVLKTIDNNTQMMEMYCTDASGKENKTMEIRSTRL